MSSVVKLNDSAFNEAKWKNKKEYILACLGYTVGITSVCRFPYVCYKNGGGAFIITYIFMFIFCGLPAFFMETSLGQFSSSSCLGVFKICPLFKGTGFTVMAVCIICIAYFTYFIAYSLVYLFYCFQKELPWFHCNNSWNTPNCVELTNDLVFLMNFLSLYLDKVSNLCSLDSVVVQFIPISQDSYQDIRGSLKDCIGDKFYRINNVMHTSYINFTQNAVLKTPADEFFNRHILQISSGIEEMGNIVTPLLIANIISWILMYLCVMHGTRSIGKVVYVTATLPYILLFTFLVRSIMLPGAWKGIQYYIYPQWTYLVKVETWVAGANQLFFSLGPGWGTMLNISSYNKFKNNNKKDSILVSTLNALTCIFSGFVVFSILGYMSHQTGLAVSDVASGGLSLAYITYPQAISLLPLPHLWAVLFFLMLISLCLDSCFTIYETIVSVLIEGFPVLRKYKKIVYISIAFTIILCSSICSTNGGIYIIQLLDWYTVSTPVIVICFIEVFVVGWVYGAYKFARDIEFMIDARVHLLWCICWKYITPIILLFILITAFVFDSPVIYNGVEYPTWAITLGRMSSLFSIIWIPVYAIYKLVRTKGSLIKRIKLNLRALESWGPALSEQRKLWILYTKQNINLMELQKIRNIDINADCAVITPNLTELIDNHF